MIEVRIQWEMVKEKTKPSPRTILYAWERKGNLLHIGLYHDKVETDAFIEHFHISREALHLWYGEMLYPQSLSEAEKGDLLLLFIYVHQPIYDPYYFRREAVRAYSGKTHFLVRNFGCEWIRRSIRNEGPHVYLDDLITEEKIAPLYTPQIAKPKGL